MDKARLRVVAMRACLVLGGMALLTLAGGSLVAWNAYDRVRATLPSVHKLQDYEPSVPSTVWSRDGVKIGELFDEKRYPLRYADIGPLVVKSFLAAEDAHFRDHGGVDWQGFARAGFHYLTKTGTKQGGSTITQQLAKILLLTRERTVERKVKDILLAFEIEKSFSKEQILEMYLNTIFLGNHSYGVEAAARNYFRKSNGKLTLAEAAMIAGITPAPSAYAPTESLEKAKTRQRFVLEQMLKHGWATKAEVDAALVEKLKIHNAESPNTRVAPFFLMEVKKQLEDKLKLPGLLSKGYRVTTTLDMGLQRKSDDAVRAFLAQQESRKGFKGALRRHGEGFEEPLRSLLGKPFDAAQESARAVVVDIYPNLDAVAVVTQQGLGLLLLEDHRWALRAASRAKESGVLDFADIVRVGDEVHVEALERGTPRRLEKSASAFNGLKRYEDAYPHGVSYQGVRYYKLTDTEGVEAAAVVMKAASGEVLALVGGENFERNQFNRATQARRQVGSGVKPLYYAWAMDQGFSPASQIDTPPIVIGDWKPENYSKEFTGRTTLRTSLIQSYNISSIQIFQALGISKVTSHLQRLGLPWPQGDLSLALGSGNATLLQMTQAYSPFANAGRLTEARMISKVEDRKGNTVVDADDERLRVAPVGDAGGAEVISPAAAYVTVRVMQDVVRLGTGTRASGVPHGAGKTGTTNGYTDAWFMGVTPTLVGGVWVGFDDVKKSLGSEGTGSKMAAPVWKDIMMAATQIYPSTGWKEPSGVTNVRIEPDTGKPALGGGGLLLPVVSGTEPGAPGSRNALGQFGFEGASTAEEESLGGAQGEENDTGTLRGMN
jgi:penicillin-binding protein 1A